MTTRNEAIEELMQRHRERRFGRTEVMLILDDLLASERERTTAVQRGELRGSEATVCIVECAGRTLK